MHIQMNLQKTNYETIDRRNPKLSLPRSQVFTFLENNPKFFYAIGLTVQADR